MNKKYLFLIILIFSTLVVAQESQKDKVRIGCYNIQIFGKSKVERPNTLTVLAKIASTYDVLAIEEVGSNGSTASDETCTAVMDAYVDRINQIAGANTYSYVRGNQYAIIYRTNDFSVIASGLYSGSQSFTYRPLTAYFKSTTGNLDFAMIVIHTSPAKAKTEISSLKAAMTDVANQYSEPDVICLGDYNADGSYYTEGTGTNLEGFTSPDYITAIPNSADTTVAASSNTYDRIELSSSMDSDYDGTWGVIEPGKVYDMKVLEGTKTTTGTEAAISDHYPVWAEFYIDRDTD
jgi:endonuclease/exonuclease/phosphatase family metal-dependent hydrolase